MNNQNSSQKLLMNPLSLFNPLFLKHSSHNHNPNRKSFPFPNFNSIKFSQSFRKYKYPIKQSLKNSYPH